MRTVIVDGIKYRLPNTSDSFREHLFLNIARWKRQHITTDLGVWRGMEYDHILPERYKKPPQYPHLYPTIVQTVENHRQEFNFRLHPDFYHMDSSQAAAFNLFLPILISPEVNNILRQMKPDFAELAVSKLDHGFALEYWDNRCFEPTGDKTRGVLNESGTIRTAADIAIAYKNQQGELCLWLIEHKLAEKDFTPCGGATSSDRRAKHDCSCSFTSILLNPEQCFYHDACHYNYWQITATNQDFFANHTNYSSCPFRHGLNQLWRNQLLGLGIEQDKSLPYRHVTFSVVHHPGNRQLEPSILMYQKLIAGNPRFTTFQSSDLIHAAQRVDDPDLNNWVQWYGSLYNL
jgi:hypothetical protein